MPLEDARSAEESPSAVLRAHSTVYKGVSSQDGTAYAVRRINGRSVLPQGEVVRQVGGFLLVFFFSF